MSKHFYGVELGMTYFTTRFAALDYYEKYFPNKQDALTWVDYAVREGILKLVGGASKSDVIVAAIQHEFGRINLEQKTSITILFIDGLNKIKLNELHNANVVLQDLTKDNNIPYYYVWKNRYGPGGYMLHVTDLEKFIRDPYNNGKKYLS